MTDAQTFPRGGMALIAELKRRKVIKVAVGYALRFQALAVKLKISTSRRIALCPRGQGGAG